MSCDSTTPGPSWAAILRHLAASRPEGTAVRFLPDGERDPVELTYGELCRRVHTLADHLARQGGPGERALLLFPPGLDYVTALLACFCSGVVAVPAYPPRAARGLPRVLSLAADSRPRLVLGTPAVLGRLRAWSEGARVLADALWMSPDDAPALDGSALSPASRGEAPGADDLALLQYTSGSTGDPKGVLLTHGNLLANSERIHRRFGMAARREVVSWLPPYHDMGLIGGILQPLYAGVPATLMSPFAFLQSPVRWLRAISGRQGVVSGGPNFAYELCLRKVSTERRRELDLSGWEVAFNGAEPVRAETMQRFSTAFREQGFRAEAFYPCYGLAEATLMVAGGEPGRRPPVETLDARPVVGCGGSLDGQEVAVVGPESLTSCAPGEVGEVWVQGPSVGGGYWGRPELSASTFRALLAGREGEWLRTGDLGFLRGGELFVTGRMKDLLILRGRNLYPQDVEATVERCHPALRPAAGVAFAVEVDGEERLVVVQEVEPGREGEASEAVPAVREAVAAEHEAALHEVVLVRAGEVPRTSSGKVRRGACRDAYLAGQLAALPSSIEAAAPPVPVSPDASGESRLALIQTCLAEQAARVLGSTPEPERPLLSLGLDSLQAVEVQQGVERALGIAPSLADLLGGATVAEMAARLAEAGDGKDAPAAEGETCGIHPASVGQRGFWFLSRLAPESGAWNVAAAARLLGAPDPAALRRAFERLAERHPALRTTLSAPGDEPVQVVHADVEMDWAEEDGTEDLAARLSLAADLPFDLERGPLLRVRLFHGPEGAVLLLVVHHAIADLLSLTILVRDLGRLYAAEIEAAPLPPPPGFRPSDFARDQARRLAGAEGERLRRFWEEALSGHLPVLALPFDRPRPPVETWRGLQRRSALSPGTAAGLRDLGKSGGATLFTTLLAAWCTLLHRVSGQDAVLVGSPAAGRSHAAWAGVAGYFANPLVLRADLAGVSTFAQLLGRMRQTVLRGLLHQDYPFPLLVDRLLPDRDPSHPPLFQAGFALQDGVTAEERALAAFAAGHPGVRLEAGGLVLESLTVEPRSSQFELMLTAAPAGEGLALALLARSDLFDTTTVERLLGHLETLLRELAAGGADRPFATLPLLAAAERQQVLREWNDTDRAYPASPLLHAPILDRAREEPERVALVFPGGTLTYSGLIGQAAAVAGSLRGLGAGPDTPVGVLAERSAEMVVALLGTLLADGAWLPLDPEQPRERLRSLWQDAGEPVILFQDHLRDRLPAGARGVVLSGTDRAVDRADGGAVDAGHLAYVLYTSGSTGRPKGAMNSHRAIANRLDWMQEAFGLTPDDRVLQKTPFGFDVSVWEFFWPLREGARLVMAPPGAHRDTEALVELIEREGITTIHFVPSLLAAFLEREDLGRCASLRRVIASGEALPPSLAERFHERLGGPFGVELWNLYGPTEAAVDVTAWKVEAGAERGTVPIGRPIANTTIHLLDRGGHAAPPGVAGELCIGGVAPARGYLSRPDLTAERFLPDPLASEPGARLYRTGDLARRRADGALEYLGRLDHQIKLRGVRIEPGEIEEALGAFPGVREAAVRLLDNRLVGYLACDLAAPPEPAEVRRALAERLPDVMIPSAFVLLPDFPRTASGKVDRRALPVPELSAQQGGGPSPETPLEQALAEVWSEVLGLPRVGLDDNFFALGGDSILTLRVQTLAARRGLRIAFQDLFRHRTLRELAAAVGSGGSEGTAAHPATAADPAPFALVPSMDLPHLPAGLDDAYPLTRVFAGLVFHSEHSPDYQIYLTSVHLAHPLDPGALQGAADALVRRHPILRTSFSLGATSRPLQLVHREASLPVRVVDLRALSAAAHEPALAAWREAELVHRFDWAQAPLARLTVHLRGATAQLSLSEPVLDGWSVATLLTELLTFYHARLSGLPDPALPPAAPLRDYVALELQALASDDTRAFWRQTLAEATPGLIPRWSPGVRAERPARAARAGLPIHRREVPLPPELPDALAAASRALALPVKSLLLAAHSKVTGLLQGEDDALTGFLLNGRPEIEGGDRTAGLFLHPVPLRLRRSAFATWADLAAGAFAAERELLPHRRLPLAELQREQGGPLFDSVFNFTHFHVYRELARLPEVEVLDGFASDQTYVDLTAQFNLDHATGRLRLALDCRARRFGGFDPAQAEAIGGLYRRVLEALAANVDARHDAGAPLGAAERHALLVEHNDTAAESPGGDLLLHQLFAAQVARTPEAVALVFEGEVTSYGALARRAGRLAAALREAGVAPGDPVAVCAERSSWLLVGLLAVLEAGGAFLPLDPAHPADRLAWMLEDGLRGVRRPLLLTEPRWLGLPVIAAALRGGVRPVLLEPREEDADRPDGPPRRDPGPHALPDGPAYALYTSGSTGRPKGVLNTHRGIVNRLLWMQAEHGLGPDDRVLQKTPLTFDVSVWELFWPLLTGAALVLARPGGHLDPAYLAGLIQRERVTTLHFVPSLLRVFLETPEAAGCRSLRRVIASGEALDPDLVRRFHEVFPSGPEIHNLYGPTEAAVDVTAWPCRRGLDGAAEGGLPIGRPVANTTIHLLDALARPVPLGSPGELCIGGVQLARGYLGRPDLTAGRFIPDPFSAAPGGRLYRTGDLARRRTDGSVEFLGRLDHQVKLRGQRIEPGEIEAALREHPEVAEAVVVVAGERQEHRRLIAYAVPASGAAPARDVLLGFLEARLPRFMVPSDLVVLASLPRTPSGKVDRRALPPPPREEDRIAALLARVRALSDDEVQTLLAQEER